MANNDEVFSRYLRGGKGTTTPKIRIEFNDNQGAKYSFSVKGLNKQSMIKLIDFVQSVSQSDGQTDARPEPDSDAQRSNGGSEFSAAAGDTNIARVYLLIETKFRFGSFTSGDVREACEDEVGLPLPLPTVSTYLSRLTARGLLVRTRNGAGWVYRFPREEIQARREQELHEKPMTSDNAAI